MLQRNEEMRKLINGESYTYNAFDDENVYYGKDAVNIAIENVVDSCQNSKGKTQTPYLLPVRKIELRQSIIGNRAGQWLSIRVLDQDYYSTT